MKKTPTNYLFAQIDILGFSNLISKPPRNLSLNNLKISYELFFKKSLKTSKDFIKINKPKYVVFSDTAFIYREINEEVESDIIEFFKYLSCILQNSFYSMEKEHEKIVPELYFKFPIRGAFSAGELIVDPVLIGKPIITTYQWERSQNWLGISIPQTDISKFKNIIGYVNYNQLISQKLLIEHDIPTKEGLISSFALNFITEGNKTKILKIVDEELNFNNKNTNIYAKYYATKQFIENIINNGQYISDFC